MGILLTLIAGLVIWIVLWSIGVKSFDAFMLTMLIIILAAGTRMLLPHLPGNQRS